MNFDMTNTPSTFVTMMNNIFREDIGKYVVIYLDDIIIFSKMEDQHIQDLKQTLSKLRYHKSYTVI